jgi:hypothetical protein
MCPPRGRLFYLVAIHTFLALLIIHCRADCLPDPPNLREQFEISPVVARLTAPGDMQHQQTMPCSVEFYDEVQGAYIFKDTVLMYSIIELFKGDLSNQVSDNSTGVVWATDTGYREALPSRYTDDSLGFLAFLSPVETCYSTNTSSGETMLIPYPDPATRSFEMNECDLFANSPWSDVSDDDKAFLRSETAPSSSPTDSPVTTSEGHALAQAHIPSLLMSFAGMVLCGAI